MRTDKNVNISFNFLSVLTIVFITLKLCKVIDWSWWWVLAPTWIPLSIITLIVVVYIVCKKIREKVRGF